MAINTSINKLRETQNSLDSIKDSINNSIAHNRSRVADTISRGKQYIYKYQQAISNCEKDISYAKKVIDENQSAIYSFERDINTLKQKISSIEWEISRTGYPPKPNSTGNTEVDSANRRNWEDACDAIDDKLDALKESKEAAIQARDRFIQLKEKAESNISDLRKIIGYIKDDISSLNTMIHNLNVKMESLRRAESIYLSECQNAVSALRKIDNRIEVAIVKFADAIREFKQAGISMNESSVIDISDINKCNIICRDIKNNLLNANQSKGALESAISTAQRDLKDNVTNEASKIIDKIKAEYSIVVDALEQINRAVDKAMEYLHQYENS